MLSSKDLPNPGAEPISPALAGRLFTTNATWEALAFRVLEVKLKTGDGTWKLTK